ncbi:potassium channel family protein [Thermospira aquatica]|uniref:NAD-binding protein n=1 Tax=Thermospira aquatica TaxID=2828656 RepID=A0AAX3BB80_9SPIR|nr:potassium channel family protein [Thermospira aquatica]URA09360.1 NAD-binding protein [Thermospira aquatica]
MRRRNSWFKTASLKLANLVSEPSNQIVLVLFVFLLGMVPLIWWLERSGGNDLFRTLGDALWWLIVTIPTVGYGDIVPRTAFGRLLGVIVIVFGVAFYAILSGQIVSFLIDKKLKERRGLAVVRVKKHVLVLGVNGYLERFLMVLPEFMGDKAMSVVLVNDMSEDEFLEVKDKFPHLMLRFVFGDYTKEAVLRRAGVENAFHAFILADNFHHRSLDDADDRTIMATLSLKAIHPDLPVSAEVIKIEKASAVKRAGVENVIFNGAFSPTLLSAALVSPAVPLFFQDLVANYESPRLTIVGIEPQFIGKPFREYFLAMREKYRLMVVGIYRTEKELSIEDMLSGNDAIDEFIRSKLRGEETEETKYHVNINPPDDYILSSEDTYAFVIR